MLAYRYFSDKSFRLEEIEQPEIKNDEALIKVDACSICGTDLRTYRFGSSKIDDGRVIGHEVVGTIVQTGEYLDEKFRVGNKVAIAPAIGCGKCPSCLKGRTNMCDDLNTIGYQYDGGFAEYMAIPGKAFGMGNVYHLPESADYSLFAISEPLACAINAQSFLTLKPGESVIIFGAGIIGCLHAELALSAGADPVVIVEPSAERLQQSADLLRNVVFINSGETDLEKKAAELTDGFGFDIAIIACSVGKAQEQGLSLLAKGGRISLFGGLAGESTGFIDSNLIHYRELGVFGVHASTPDQNRKAMKLIAEGKIDVAKFLGKRYELKQIEQAFKDISSGSVIKAVVEFK